MPARQRISFGLLFTAFVMISMFIFTACGPSSQASSSGSSSNTHLKNISIGLGYLPDVQFAPFYVAQSKGYYKAAGLNVTFHHGIVPDLVGSMVAGKNDFVIAGGDDLLQARDKGVQAIDVGTIFEKYAISLIVPANSSIKTLSDLKGKTIGIPGAYGSTYTGLLALLYSAHLTVKDVKLESIGFTQVAALISHKVDAIMGYSNNEPLQLAQRGFPVRTYVSSDYQPLVSNGLVTMDSTYTSQPQEVRAVVQATLKGLKDVIADPDGALKICQTYVPSVQTNPTQSLAVLKATIPIWEGNGHLGYTDGAAMASMEKFMVAQKMIAPVKNLSQTYTNQFVP
jgi:NitT/TauT family transport system substrate-binding protein